MNIVRFSFGSGIRLYALYLCAVNCNLLPNLVHIDGSTSTPPPRNHSEGPSDYALISTFYLFAEKCFFSVAVDVDIIIIDNMIMLVIEILITIENCKTIGKSLSLKSRKMING